MSKPTISREQAIQGLLTLGAKVNWDEIPVEDLQAVINDEDGETGQQFTAFLKNRGKLVIGEPKIVKIDRSSAFNPGKFLSKGWTIWKGPADGDGLSGKEDQDKRALVLTELDLSKVRLVNMLNPKEASVHGEEKQKRLVKAGHICLDAGAFRFFWKNQHLIPPSWKGKVVYFDGTKLRSPNGVRYVLCLSSLGDEWGWRRSWLGDLFGALSLSAVLAS